MRLRRFLVLIGLCAALLTHLPVQAERRENDAADAMRKAQLMIRKLSAERSRLEAENAELNTRVKTLDDKVTGLESGLSKTRQQLGKSKKRTEKLVGRIKSDVDKFKALTEKYRQTVGTLRSAMNDNRLLVNAVQERDAWMGQCRTRNEDMYKANLELLDLYKNKSVADVVKAKEPLFGIGRVELETSLQEYRFKLEDLTVTPFQPATALPPQAKITN